MKVYDGANWDAATSAGGASLLNYNFTATAGQTAFSGADDNSQTLSYVQSNIIVTLNGITLEDGTDYTATDGVTITLTSAAAAGDELNVVAFKTFAVADVVSASTGGSFGGSISVNGTVTATSFSGDGSGLTGVSAGGGLYKGENGTVGSNAGDIFRINQQTINTSVTIDATENASATGPIAVASGVTLTVSGNLSIV